jgi:hypothetical protein
MINPWIAVWTRPRHTIRHLVTYASESALLPLAAVGGVVQALDRASSRSLGDNIPFDVILALCGALGPLIGIIELYLGSALISWTGRWIGGNAESDEIRTAVAWANVPLIGVFVIWILQVVLLGPELFTTLTPRLDGNAGVALTFLASGLAQITLGIWAFFILMKGLGEVQGFSAWKALGNVLLSSLAFVVPILLLALIVIAVG